MKSSISRWLRVGIKKRQRRGRGKRHVLHAQMNPNEVVRRLVVRLVALTLVGASLAAAALVTSLGMDVILGNLLYKNGDFAVRRFQIEQQGKIGKGELVSACGVKIGQNLIQISLGEVKESIQRLPKVASVRVERRLPDTLYLCVEERQPVALIYPTPTAGMQLALPTFYIDARGYILKPKPGEKLLSLPVVRGISSDEVVEGERTSNSDLKAALLFLRVAMLAPVRDGLDISTLVIEGPGRFLVSMPRGGKVRFRTSYLEEQLDRLAVIFEYAQTKGRVVHTVDLTPERNVPVTFLN